MDRPRLLYFLACHNFVCLPVLWIDCLSPSSQRHTNGSLLSMVKSRALMVAEVLRYDQTLPRKPGSRPT
jgi:hypothetical protein